VALAQNELRRKPIKRSSRSWPSPNFTCTEFSEVRSQLATGYFETDVQPLKFIADSLPPTIMRHEKAKNTERRAKATRAADTWVEGIIARIAVVVDESIHL
jgi:hypothetical protein